MNIREYASQFSAIILSKDIDFGARAKINFSKVGYEVYFIQDPDSALGHIQQTLPHVVFFDLDFLQIPLNEFVQNILQISTEIKLVIMGPDSEFEPLSEYAPYGVSQVLARESGSLEQKTLWTMDRICEALYLTYQNEELIQQNVEKTTMAEQLQNEISSLNQQQKMAVEKAGAFRDVETLIQSYKTSESKEQVINLFFEQIQGVQAIFMKYLPSVRSFVSTHGMGLPTEKVLGLNCQLQAPEAIDLISQVSLGVLPGSLALMMKNEFGLVNLSLFPLFVQGGLEGVVITSIGPKSEYFQNFSNQFSLFSLAFSHLALEKKIEVVDLQDAVTEVYNSKYYRKKLDEEVGRARRLKKPLSVVKIAIDDFDEIEQTLGADVRDHVLKTIASLMVKSSRAHDFVARIQMNELALVLVHCSKHGAGIRADRVRRIVETSSALDHGVKLSVSVGISEYPSLCDTGNDLDQTSSQALAYIFQKGGNRLCLYKAPPGFRPEFEVTLAEGES